FFDNLVISNGKLFVSARNVGAVFVYDLDAMLNMVESPFTDPTFNVIANRVNTPIDNLILSRSQSAQGPNSAIDINADYRLDIPFQLFPLGTPGDPDYVPPSQNIFKDYGHGSPIGFGPNLPQGLGAQIVAPVLKIHGPQVVTITTRVNRVTGDVCPDGGEFTFDLNLKAKVTLRVGQNGLLDVARGIATNPLDPAQSLARFENIELAPGTYTIHITPTGIGPAQLGAPGEYDYSLDVVSDDGQMDHATGKIVHEVEVDGSYPVGHTMIKGVDIWDGHLTHSTQDVMIPGRGLSLDFTRTYSSAGDSAKGPLGAGWTHS